MTWYSSYSSMKCIKELRFVLFFLCKSTTCTFLDTCHWFANYLQTRFHARNENANYLQTAF